MIQVTCKFLSIYFKYVKISFFYDNMFINLLGSSTQEIVENWLPLWLIFPHKNQWQLSFFYTRASCVDDIIIFFKWKIKTIAFHKQSLKCSISTKISNFLLGKYSYSDSHCLASFKLKIFRRFYNAEI
jgi:hypothetical protein